MEEEWLKENLPGVWEKEFCPPSSPNLSLLDCSVWGVSELLANAKFYKKIEYLNQKMKVEMGTVVKAC
jgi:hypothetical protein